MVALLEAKDKKLEQLLAAPPMAASGKSQTSTFCNVV
jgi:hypothetical protein